MKTELSGVVLALAANARDHEPLSLSEEIRGIQRALQDTAYELVQCTATRTSDLRMALLVYRPTFIHFCGHGQNGRGIWLLDDYSNSKLVSGTSLARILSLFSAHVRCVLLNCCHSIHQAREISREIDYTIGMNSRIDDESATVFAVSFYEALSRDTSIEFCFNFAKRAIGLEGNEFAHVPKLFRPSESARSDLKPEKVKIDLPTEKAIHSDSARTGFPRIDSFSTAYLDTESSNNEGAAMADGNDQRRNRGIIISGSGKARFGNVAIGNGATVIENHSAPKDREVREALGRLSAALQLELDSVQLQQLRPEIARVEDVAIEPTRDIASTRGILESLVGKLDLMGVVVSKSAQLTQCLRRLSGLIGVEIGSFGLGR